MSDEDSLVPLPGTSAEKTLKQVIVLFNKGKHQQAARLLQNSFNTAFGPGKGDTYFDSLHFSNAVIRFKLEEYITDEEFRSNIQFQKMYPLIYSLPDWLQDAYSTVK